MKFNLNLPLSIGLLIFSATLILNSIISIPNIPYNVLRFTALALELWGIIRLARSPEMKRCKLRQWKLRLIGKGDS